MLKQRNSLRRTSQKLPQAQPWPRGRQIDDAPVRTLVPSTIKSLVSGSYAEPPAAAPVPKGEPARTGKRAPTVADRAWMDWCVAHGCVACLQDGMGYVEPCIHHILRGGVRMGHLHTLPLCPGHHQAGTGRPGLIARHPDKARFELRYGTEAELLASLQAEFARRAA